MNKQVYYIIGGICIITYLLGMFGVPLMDIDASQYASISREMLVNKSYLQVFDLGRDYLDKPPMLFWMSSLSMYVFGIHDWAYRLPSFLFSLLAIYSTYRFALLYYKEEIALLSAVVLASSQAMFLINHDVRTDTMLMGWVICSIWQMAAWYKFQHWRNLALAAIAIAGGMMTKGPIALMVIVFAFLPQIIAHRDWKQLYRWEYIPLLAIIGLLLLPMSRGLYEQYDLHPEKVVNGQQHVSGLRFFYWTQSFGRITGESQAVESNVNIFFLLQNMLWSFLPWIIFFLTAVLLECKAFFRQNFRLPPGGELISLGGFLITYCALGSSKAQLPHYIFIVFPLAAIVTAKFLYQLLFTTQYQVWLKPFLVFHGIIYLLLWIACVALMVFPFSHISNYVAGISIACLIGYIILWFTNDSQLPRLLSISFFTIIGINIFLATAFYPCLLEYQTGNIVAKYIEEKKIPKNKLHVFGNVVDGRNSLYFYGNYFFKRAIEAKDVPAGDYILCSEDDFKAMNNQWKNHVIYKDGSFPVTKLSFEFLNPKTRPQSLGYFYIVQTE